MSGKLHLGELSSTREDSNSTPKPAELSLVGPSKVGASSSVEQGLVGSSRDSSSDGNALMVDWNRIGNSTAAESMEMYIFRLG